MQAAQEAAAAASPGGAQSAGAAGGSLEAAQRSFEAEKAALVAQHQRKQAEALDTLRELPARPRPAGAPGGRPQRLADRT